MNKTKEGRSAIQIAIERGITCVTEKDIAAVPLETPGSDSVLAPEGKRVGSRQRRLRAFIHAAEQILTAEMQEQFPELASKVLFYQGWHPGSEKSGAEVEAEARARTGDLFRSTGTKELAASRSTRSSDVNIGAVLHAPA